ncbi:MAG: acireductone dioxygenase [Granulosicoccus sp.]
MTTLIVKPEDQPNQTLLQTTDPLAISDELGRRNIRFEQWQAGQDLRPSAGQEQVLSAYDADIQKLKAQGYDTVDVVALSPEPGNPDWPAKAAKARQMFLQEHTHADDEVRFFVAGKGCFYLRVDGEVLITMCEKGDLIWVPAGTTHWFDMGTQPMFTAIRFFRIPEGWVGEFTGNQISGRFPSFDELNASTAT